MEKNNKSKVELWNNFGFLTGFEGEKKEKLAELYDELANSIITDENFTQRIDEKSHWTEVLNSYYDNKITFDVLEVILFPVLKRVFSNLDGDVKWEEFKESLFNISLEKFNKSNENIQKEIKENKLENETIDYEATLVAMYADIITAKITSQRKK